MSTKNAQERKSPPKMTHTCTSFGVVLVSLNLFHVLCCLLLTLPANVSDPFLNTRVILKVFSVMFSAQTALDYREQCFGGQAQSLIAARC